MRRAGPLALAAAGCAWPFAAHWLAVTHWYATLAASPARWIAYSALVVALPCPAMIFGGAYWLGRDELPPPARYVVPGLAAAVVLAVVAAVFFLAVGLIGFRVPF